MELAELLSDATAQQRAVDRALDEVARVRADKRVTVEAPDHSVTVTVDGNGMVRTLALATRLSRCRSIAAYGTTIRDTVNAARSDAAHRGERLVARSLATVFPVETDVRS